MILIINSEMIHCYNESLKLIICMLIYVNYDQVYKSSVYEALNLIKIK